MAFVIIAGTSLLDVASLRHVVHEDYYLVQDNAVFNTSGVKCENFETVSTGY